MPISGGRRLQKRSAPPDTSLDQRIPKILRSVEHAPPDAPRQSETASLVQYTSTSTLDETSLGDSNDVLPGCETAEEQRIQRMRAAVETLLLCIGEDPQREGLVNTPLRYAKALMSLTGGYAQSLQTITNDAFFHVEHAGMVVVKNIQIHSLCEHHLLPFTGKVHVGYIPSDRVVGISKLARIAEMYARRLQVQERLTRQIAEALAEVVSPTGVAVVVEADHLCMRMRGVQQAGATTGTSCFLGHFETDAGSRGEFYRLVGSITP